MRGIWENVVGGALATLAVAVAVWAASRFDVPVPLWLVLIVGACGLVFGMGLGRLFRYGEDLAGYQADLVADAILGLREVIAGKLNLPFEEFIERGVLAPARYGISAVRGEEIRLAVLQLDETESEFRMLYESGHSLGRKSNFSLSRTTLAGHALESRELQWTNDVDSDARWTPHPKADGKRRYRSLAAMPIIVADRPVAVLNVVSSEKGAFLSGDLTYIELLGGFIGLAWALNSAESTRLRIGLDEIPKGER